MNEVQVEDQLRLHGRILRQRYVHEHLRLYDSLVNMKIPAEQCVIQLFYAISCFYYCANNYNFYSRTKEIAEFITLFFKFDQRFPVQSHQIRKTKKFGESLLAFLAAGLGNGMFQGPCFLYFSKNRNFLFSVVEPLLEPEIAYWATFPFALLEMWLSTLSWCGSLLHTFIWFAIANCIPLWTSLMIYSEKRKLSRPMRRTLYYRSLQCLMVQFNDCYACFSFIGVKISAFFGLICVLYGSLRFYGKISIVGYAVLPLSIFMGFLYGFLMFPAAGHASDALNDMLKGWSKIGLCFLDKKETRVIDVKQDTVQPDERLMNTNIPDLKEIADKELGESSSLPSRSVVFRHKPSSKVTRFKLNSSFIKSCPTVGFHVGGFYCVKTATTFTFCDMVINQTINCLLSF